MLDILHQLLKRVVGGTHMLHWLKNIVGAKFKGAHVKAGAMRSLHQANRTVLLDERLCCVPFYPTLKIFKEYSKVKKWDRSEYWAACRQLVPVVALLLIKDDPALLQFVRTIIDFVHMAQYKLHNNQTLRYMQHAFCRINQTKGAFRDARQTDAMIRAGKAGHFIFRKWYVICYYHDWIKLYGSVTGFITGIEETIYITWIKDFFKRTNIRKSHEKQIHDHSVKKFSLMVRANLDIFSSAETLTQVDQNAALQVNSVSGAKKIMEDLKWHLGKNWCQRLQYSCLSTNYWYLAETAADKGGIPRLVDALAVFIKQERAKIKGVESTLNKRRKNDNSSWPGKYPI